LRQFDHLPPSKRNLRKDRSFVVFSGESVDATVSVLYLVISLLLLLE
jgi:hypothetical protein